VKIAYFDCFAGAGGDMIVAAMLDAGIDQNRLKEQLATIGLENMKINIFETKRAGIKAIKFEPQATKEHQHCHLQKIIEIINSSKITDNAKKTAISIFNRLAQAEAKVHNKSIDQIHFHEVGAVDSIVDIVAASVGLDLLGAEKIYCSTISVGGGTVECAHGRMPVPAPATAELIKSLPVSAGPKQVELLTPTAAAILATVVDEFCNLPELEIESIGYGAGSRDFEDFPNVLRLFIGREAKQQANADTVCLLETNVDDVSGEMIGAVVEQLFDEGALDVFTTPIYMKRGRPGIKISVICRTGSDEHFAQVLFRQGITLGVRKQNVRRYKLGRDFKEVETEYGKIKIKVGLLDGEVVNFKPEFADCLAAAKKHKVAVKDVCDATVSCFKKSR